MRRTLLAGALVVAILGPLAGSASASETHQVNATMTHGRAVPYVVPEMTSNPTDPSSPSDYLCQYRLHRGKFTDSAGYLDSGTYSGRIIIDYSTLAYDSQYGEDCALTRGVIKMKNSTGRLRITVVESESETCDNPDGSKDLHLAITIKPGGQQGSFTNVTGGSLQWEGTWVPLSSDPGTFKDSAQLVGTVETT
jgi:hypothetical protein